MNVNTGITGETHLLGNSNVKELGQLPTQDPYKVKKFFAHAMHVSFSLLHS
jgi:hypothetical protein